MAADDGDAADRPAPADPEPDTAGDNTPPADEPVRRPTPGGRHAAPEPEPATAPNATSRRGVLLGVAAVVLAGGGGVGAGLLARRRRAPVRPEPPAALLAAAAVERRLIVDLDATTGGAAEVRAVIAQARADHAAHLEALEALLGAYRRPATAAPSAAARGTARTAAQLREAETDAAVAAGRRAAASTGSLATLFASISACESAHAALLA